MMSKKDIPYNVGLMVGLIIGTLTMRALGYVGIVQLIGGVVVGVGLGWLLDTLYKKSERQEQQGQQPLPPPPPLPGEGPYVPPSPVARQCPYCGAVAPAASRFCPKCGRDIP